MAKPPATHHLDLSVTVRGERFALSGVFLLAEGLAAMDRWVAQLDGGLTADQVNALQIRAERLARRLETLDATTP